MRDERDAKIGKIEIAKLKNLHFTALELIIEEPYLELLAPTVKEISDSFNSVTLKVFSEHHSSNQPKSKAFAIFSHYSKLDIRLVDMFSVA